MAQIIVCDICGERDNVNRRYYVYGRQADGAGGREDVCEMFDLCQAHEIIAFRLALKAVLNRNINTEYEMNGLIISEIKKMIFAKKLQKKV